MQTWRLNLVTYAVTQRQVLCYLKALLYQEAQQEGFCQILLAGCSLHQHGFQV